MTWMVLFMALLNKGLSSLRRDETAELVVGNRHIVVKGKDRSFLITIEEL